jgi:hypothetical protein
MKDWQPTHSLGAILVHGWLFCCLGATADKLVRASAQSGPSRTA